MERRTNAFAGPLHLAFILLVLLAGCDASDPVGPDRPDGELTAVVVNSVEITLTVFPVDDPGERRTVALGPEGTPVGGAVRGEVAAIPMGVVPAVVVVDLSSGSVLRTISLPEGSGATGAHFVNDSIALVANPGLDSVSPVNVRSGEVGDAIPTGRYPQGFVQAGGTVFVVNSELVDFAPAGPGTLTALDAGSLAPLGTVELSGENSGAATVGPEGTVLVLNSGHWGAGDGTLSVVDPDARAEIDLHAGFGDFPGSITLVSASRLLASSWSFGVAEWNPSTGTFTRSPDDAAAPGGMPSSAGVAVDPSGDVWSLGTECQDASKVFRLTDELEVAREVSVGVCPSSILFTTL